ncbi:phosphoribosylamine/glycine ligase [Dehalogenimonas lykanthroporepellens BL-DC-9]|nr:phosphoribosylamine/glycine ligase [Dehalogenimonas lykanthroporepellens BL-DC-9]
MKLLVIGNGGREHAIAWKLKQSSQVEKVYVAPGNGGTAIHSDGNLDIDINDFNRLIGVIESKGIDMVVVGPEGPLMAGIVDELQSQRIPVFGPTRDAARLEGSKEYARYIMEKNAIPCARGCSFTLFEDALKYLRTQSIPVVVKADGLAAGKGVSVCFSQSEAEKALSNIMQKRVFGDAGSRVIIEECLEGQELSVLAFTDGQTIQMMSPACDYKRAFNGNCGPNTGGMGAYSPPPFFNSRLEEQIRATIMEPVIRTLGNEGIVYRGVLYAGIMLTHEGPKVLEFNARFGDPETQIILPLLKTDLAQIMKAVINGTLGKQSIEWENNACVTVVIASGGYPGDFKKGLEVHGLDNLEQDIMVFHAGTRISNDNRIVTSGGRVLNVTACGNSIAEARDKVYRNIDGINFEGSRYRSDIAFF